MLNRNQQPEISLIEPILIPSPEKRIMPNGMPLFLIQAGEEEVVRLDILIHGGQWNQSQPLQAMFTNRMLREGTSNYTSAEIAEKLDYYGAWLHLSSSMNYAYITLYSLNKYFAQTVEIVRSLVIEPLFPEKELSITIEKNRQQFNVNNSKVDVLARKELNRSLFGTEHPCGKYAVEEDYDKLNRKVLKQFHAQFYHSGHCTLYLSGKVTPEIIQKLENAFGQSVWGNVTTSPADISYTPHSKSEKRICIERNDAMQSALYMGCLTIDRKHPDFLKLRVMMTLFGGYFGSRLMNNIREEKGYTYGIGAGIASYPEHGMMIISTQAGNQYIEPIIQEVYHEMERLQNEPVSEEELTMVKNYMMGETCRNYEGPFSLADAYIYLQSSGLEENFLVQSQQAIKETTASDIQHLARTYLVKEQMKEIIAGKIE